MAAPAAVFATLGMLIVDTFKFLDENHPGNAPEEALGGSGVYSTIGARVWLDAAQVGLIADKGFDFPSCAAVELDKYGPIAVYREDLSRETTRSINTFAGQHRDFAYLNAKKRLDVEDLLPTRLTGAKYLHFACSPDRLVETFNRLAKAEWTPRICYEPIPYSCLPENLGHIQQILPKVDIFSPNHEEAAALLGDDRQHNVDRMKVEHSIERFFSMGAANIVVIRCSAKGSCGNTRIRHTNSLPPLWVPAYHSNQEKVVDATGGGNAYLGGLVAGLHRSSGDLSESMMHAAVAASFVIEQWALPDFDGRLWNGEKPEDRLERLRAEMKS